MEKSDSIYLYDYQDKIVVIEYQIEEIKYTIPGRNRPWSTDKYIDSLTWFNIMQAIDKVLKSIFDSGEDWKKMPKGTIAIESHLNLRVKYKFVSKEKSKVDMNKIPYELDWILNVKILNDSVPRDPISKKSSASSSENNVEDDSNTETSKENKNTSMDIEQKEKRIETILKNMRQESSLFEANTLPLRNRSGDNIEETSVRTFSNDTFDKKISSHASVLVNKLDSDFKYNTTVQCDDKVVTLDDSDEMIQDPKRIKVEKFKAQKKTQSGTLDTWLSSNDAREQSSSNITKRKRGTKPKNIEKTPEKIQVLLDPAQKEKIDNILEKHKQHEEKCKKRKMQLKDLEILECHDLTKAQLMEIMISHKAKVRELFDRPHRARTIPIIDDLAFNSVTLGYSLVLTEDQQLYISSHIDQLRPEEDRGTKGDILHEVVMPFLIVTIFKEKFGMELKEALKRIYEQEEKKDLFKLNSHE